MLLCPLLWGVGDPLQGRGYLANPRTCGRLMTMSPALNFWDPQDGMGYAANPPICGPLLILFPVVKCWGPLRWQRLSRQSAHMWATFDVVPHLKAPWIPPGFSFLHYTGKPTTTRWCNDGSKRHDRGGGGIYNRNYRAAVRVHGPQQVYRAETIACAVASELAREGDEIILDNQGVVNATPMKQKGVVKDQDYRDIGYHNASPGHRTLEQATTYIQGNNHCDVLVNMGDNLPMDSQQPQPHDIVLIRQIMPTPAKAWIMQVRRQKHTAVVHWVSWLPMKHYRRNAWTPWL